MIHWRWDCIWMLLMSRHADLPRACASTMIATKNIWNQAWCVRCIFLMCPLTFQVGSVLALTLCHWVMTKMKRLLSPVCVDQTQSQKFVNMNDDCFCIFLVYVSNVCYQLYMCSIVLPMQHPVVHQAWSISLTMPPCSSHNSNGCCWQQEVHSFIIANLTLSLMCMCILTLLNVWFCWIYFRLRRRYRSGSHKN